MSCNMWDRGFGAWVVLALVGSFLGTIGAVPVEAERTEVSHNDSFPYITGGVATNSIKDIYVDNEDNFYINGTYRSDVDFDPGAGVDLKTVSGISGSMDSFLSRINADGSYAYTHTAPSLNTRSLVRDVAFDAQNSMYLGGIFQGTVDLDPTPAENLETASSSASPFLTKVSASGDYEYSRGPDGAGQTLEYLDFDASGNLYVFSTFTATADLDLTTGVDTYTSAGSRDLALSKYDPAGNYLYTRVLGNARSNDPEGMAIDSQGSVYLLSTLDQDLDLDPGVGVEMASPVDGLDSTYIVKLNPAGEYLYSLVYAGLEEIDGFALEVDANDTLYLGGTYADTAVDFDPGAGVDSYQTPGDDAGFVTLIDATGEYVRTLDYANLDHDTYVYDIAFDSSNNLFVGGGFEGNMDFDLSAVGEDVVPNDTATAGFVTYLDSTGGYLNTDIFGGPGQGRAYVDRVVLTSQDKLYVGGNYRGAVDLDPGDETRTSDSGTGTDIFFTTFDVDTYQHVASLPASLQAETLLGQSLDDVTADPGILRGDTTTVVLRDDIGTPLARVQTVFGADLDWSAVRGASDYETGRVYAHNLSVAPGVEGALSLYVPYDAGAGYDEVVVCPGAAELNELSAECAGAQVLSLDDPSIEQVSDGGLEYLIVSGLSGTGAFLRTSAESEQEPGDEVDFEEPGGSTGGEVTDGDITLIRTGGY